MTGQIKSWVIGDVHGCSRTLRKLVEEKIRPSKGDELIFLGDYIDRGPDSKGVMDYIIEELPAQGLEIKALMGNHEISMAEAYRMEFTMKPASFWRKPKNDKKLAWYSYGGDTTMKSFGLEDIKQIPLHYIEWLEQLDYFYLGQQHVMVHAGLNFKNEDPFADKHAMLWIRDFRVEPERIGNRKVVHGHVPVHTELIMECLNGGYDFIDLDNGCVYTDRPGMGSLVALELGSLELQTQRNVDMM
jgi:serine/threonine protein phosphatase 1